MEEQKVRHLGRYFVTVKEARFDGVLLRTLFRRGSMPQGKLANFCRVQVEAEEWKSAVARLVEWQIVELLPNYHGESLLVKLTPDGAGWAEELTGVEQSDLAPASPKKG